MHVLCWHCTQRTACNGHADEERTSTLPVHLVGLSAATTATTKAQHAHAVAARRAAYIDCPDSAATAHANACQHQ
jgi:hypothetical protein